MKKSRSISKTPPSDDNKWNIVDGFYTVFETLPGHVLENEVTRIDSTTVVCQGNPQLDKVNKPIAPVYRLGENGPYGVPNGLIYIRFKGEHGVDYYREQIDQAGFEIEKESIAQSGWVRSKLPSDLGVIRNIDKLQELQNIEVIELQYLMSRQLK